MTVAGSILIDEEGFGKVADLLKPEDFRLDYCRAVFECARELYLAGEKTDAMLIKDKAKDRLTGEQFIQLMDLTPTARNIVEYAKLTVQNARDRALRELCQEVLSDRAEDVDVLLDKVTKGALTLEERKPKPDTISTSTALGDLISAIQNRQEGNSVVRSTGLLSLDRPLGGGLVPGSLYVLAGRPGMGKSTLALYLADQMAKEGPVLYISQHGADQVSACGEPVLLPDHR
jgi:replicative DNA helicase